jgi:hypothetical protein
MRIFLTVLIFILNIQSWTQADDIKDFEIEEMSIGDSALDYFSKKELDNAEKFTYPGEEFSEIFTHSSNYEIYDSVTLSLKKGKYEIYGISGAVDYRQKSFEDCLKAKNDIVDELKITFENSKIIDNGIYQTPDYVGDKSKRSQVEFHLDKSGGVISVDCVDWSEEAENKHGWGDNLNITLYSKEYEKFVRSL